MIVGYMGLGRVELPTSRLSGGYYEQARTNPLAPCHLWAALTAIPRSSPPKNTGNRSQTVATFTVSREARAPLAGRVPREAPE